LNLTLVDWAIVAAMYLLLVGGVLFARRLMRSVADFLAAGRTAGRYLISVSQGIAGIGAITIVANLEMNFKAGFAMSWWGLSMTLVVLVLAVSGWVIYRFRATRSLTLAEFFERRYSREFRITAGIVAFAAGLMNFAIFPSVGARFFIYFADLPRHFDLLGVTWETYPVLMAGLLVTSLWFVFAGGQVTVIFTDFLQGLFASFVFVVVPIYLLFVVSWDRVAEVLSNQPPGESLINPFDTGKVREFNFGFFLIGVFGVLLRGLGWQGEQAYNVSARSAHEAKMGGVLSMWRNMPIGLLMLLVPILAATVMQHGDLGGIASEVGRVLDGIDNERIRNQMATPLVIAHLLPAGLMGMFCAMMLAAFISTHDTYLHSWGSIFVQDFVLPLRGKPLTPGQHLRLLRFALLGVAVFIFVFSYFFVPTDAILHYFALTGAIFASWAGIVTIGGLYWKRGTTGAAWAALIVGTLTAVGGFLLRQQEPHFPIHGQGVWAIGMGASVLAYLGCALLNPKRYDLDRLLHRGRFALKEERVVVDEDPGIGWRIFGMGKEFTRRDRVLYIVTYAWTFLQIVVFVAGTVISLTIGSTNEGWLRYWQIYVWVNVALSVVIIVWFGLGGIRDIGRMIRSLSTMRRDDRDDGVVRHGHEAQ
jgi:SSS family solute:Na+ symporter